MRRSKRIKQTITTLEQQIAVYKANPDEYAGCLLAALLKGGLQ